MTGTPTAYYSYADSFLNTNTGGYTTTAGSPPSGAVTNAYLTQVTRPVTNGVAHVEKYSYGYNDGEVTQSSDENSPPKLTEYKYNDSLSRLRESDYPDGGQTILAYGDTAPSPTVTTQRLISSASYITNVVTKDGVGHVIRNKLTSDPDCATGDITAATYDGMGRVYTSSNPYCTTSDPTYGLTTYTYDALGRTTKVTHPDGTYSSTSYTGRATKVTDEGNGTTPVQRISQVDGLGRLTSVCEVTSSTQFGSGATPAACGQDISGTGFLTTYSYDTLGNLFAVSQGTLGQRTFAYDSLSRLLCAANPETGSAACPNPDSGTYTAGTTRYAYDANGNLAQRTRPAPNQTSPSTTVKTTYSYDTLNRMTQKSYSDGVTLPALYGYDQTNITMGSQQFTIANSIGRLSWTCVQAQVGSSCPSMTANSYDPMGRIAEIWQANPINSNNIFVSYGYDYLGDETSRNLSGNTDSATYNGAGRLTSYTSTNNVDANNPANLLANVQYDPMGHMISGTLANGLSLSWGYDSRGRVKAMEAGTNCSAGACSNGPYGYLMTSTSNQSGYAPNGNVLFALDSASGFWAYTYDDFNRLATSTCSGVCPNGTSTQAFSYGYDRYGNRWNQTVTAGSGPQPNYTFWGAQNNNVPNNRMDGFSYDAAGNLLNDGFNNYTYDAENRIKSVNGATTYTYDAQGRRVAKTIGSSVTDIIYDREGNVILYNANPALGSSPFVETYVAGMHLGTYYLNSTVTATSFYYAHSDWLGTERARTNLSGIACETFGSLPFGDGQTISSTCGDISHMHFTGKERDSESGLDNFVARYDSSSLGRFMTPDEMGPGQHPENPQSWNLYSYVMNNPLTLTDPTGQYVCDFQTVSASQCDNFQLSLDQAQKAANALKGSQQTDAQRAIDAYGTEGVDNGVTIAQGNVGTDQAETSVAQTVGPATNVNPNGQSITVTFDKASDLLNGKNLDAVGSLSAHEGVHVADASDWVSSGFSDNAHPSILQTEHDAYTVQMSILQGLGQKSTTF